MVPFTKKKNRFGNREKRGKIISSVQGYLFDVRHLWNL
jgi:hypothetical protein